jgi:hypothetical protein
VNTAKKLFVAFFATTHALASGSANTHIISNYEASIAEAEASTDDGRAWLRNCVHHWKDYSKQRSGVLNDFSAGMDSAAFGALLEIGSSSFSRYEYVAVLDSSVKTNLAGGDRLLTDGELKHIRAVVKSEINGMHGKAVLDKFDGDCYFLTVKLDGQTKQLAIYGGAPRTPAGMVIAELISIGD